MYATLTIKCSLLNVICCSPCFLVSRPRNLVFLFMLSLHPCDLTSHHNKVRKICWSAIPFGPILMSRLGRLDNHAWLELCLGWDKSYRPLTCLYLPIAHQAFMGLFKQTLLSPIFLRNTADPAITPSPYPTFTFHCTLDVEFFFLRNRTILRRGDEFGDEKF